MSSDKGQIILKAGQYAARAVSAADDLAACLDLRATGFATDLTNRAGDAFDPICLHVLIEHIESRTPVCTFRLLPLTSGSEILRSHAAQYYDLAALASYPGRMVELGRFCIHPARPDADILRLAWGALTRIVDREGIEMLFGCASFHGTDAQAYADAFALLHARHRAPLRWRPRVTAPRVVSLARALTRPFDPRRAMAAMPPLLRTYLTMGGWVSDHAVVDDEMGTLHVFTGVEIRAIPPARQRLLRAVAG